MPRATPEPVSCSISHVMPIISNHVPVWLMNWPVKKRRKLRLRSDRKVVPASSFSRVTSGHR